MTNENDTAEIQDRKKLFASLLEKDFPERNTLDLMPQIKQISGNKAGNKVFNKFLDKDFRGKESKRLLSTEQAFKFRLIIPNGLDAQQEFSMQENYLKNVVVGKEIISLKDRELNVAQVNKMRINLSKNLVIDFRKA